jgi:CRISPR-associated endoribonuclease Cas6
MNGFALKTFSKMRFKIILHLPHPNNVTLPINYQFELSSWIYRTIEHANPDFSAWLHEKGYSSGAQRFKFFTFSHIDIPYGGFERSDDRLIIRSETCSLQISFLLEDAALPFITGIFQHQEFEIGDKTSRARFRVKSIELQPEPEFSNQMSFATLSPIVVSRSRLSEGNKNAQYLSPGEPAYERLFLHNLIDKALVANPKLADTLAATNDFHFQHQGTVYKKGVIIKAGTPMQTKVIGYAFHFTVNAPKELLRIGFHAGFGENNSQGFGCVKIIKANKF